MSGAPWYNADLAGHLAEDAGMTPEQFERETGLRPRQVTDLARDTAVSDAEFAAETGTGPASVTSLAAGAPPPD
jgi:hypothetical protein